MIEGLRRRFSGPADSETWDPDQQLNPISNDAPDFGFPSDTRQADGGLAAYSPSTGDYYRELVSTAIVNGGRFGRHQIPVPWLRMILAGFESKRVEVEMMWSGFETDAASGDGLSESPSYNALFPSGA
jgi:hypothetical protein